MSGQAGWLVAIGMFLFAYSFGYNWAMGWWFRRVSGQVVFRSVLGMVGIIPTIACISLAVGFIYGWHLAQNILTIQLIAYGIAAPAVMVGNYLRDTTEGR